jgi:hypothetical protein
VRVRLHMDAIDLITSELTSPIAICADMSRSIAMRLRSYSLPSITVPSAHQCLLLENLRCGDTESPHWSPSILNTGAAINLQQPLQFDQKRNVQIGMSDFG